MRAPTGVFLDSATRDLMCAKAHPPISGELYTVQRTNIVKKRQGRFHG
jgi:hypothetical protein